MDGSDMWDKSADDPELRMLLKRTWQMQAALTEAEAGLKKAETGHAEAEAEADRRYAAHLDETLALHAREVERGDAQAREAARQNAWLRDSWKEAEETHHRIADALEGILRHLQTH